MTGSASTLVSDVDQLQARCAALESENAELSRINEVLMVRVERDMDGQGSSYALFQAAIALESKVKERTAALSTALQTLERTNNELKLSNEAAFAASRAKSAFLAAMSHELRTPMNGVVGMTELLLQSPLDESQRNSTVIIQRSALALLRILNDILDFSKIEAGQLVTENTAFALRETVVQSLQMLVPQIDQKGLTFVSDWAENVPNSVNGDPVRFGQIVTNLVANALKFTDAGGIRMRVRVASEQGSSVVIRVDIEDTGIGVDDSVLPLLFESFSQADGSTTRKYGGTGLGLAIVRRLSRLMGGDCGVSSEVGKGSCFWFTVALERATVAVAAPETPVTAWTVPPALSTDDNVAPHVLVVEDNKINQAVARGFLKTLGYRCTVLENGLQAVNALTTAHTFDVVMMDWQMPELDGIAATRQVREYELSVGLHTPIIALTANALVGDQDICIEAGMDDFISKPFQLRDLSSALQRWIPRAA